MNWTDGQLAELRQLVRLVEDVASQPRRSDALTAAIDCAERASALLHHADPLQTTLLRDLRADACEVRARQMESRR